MEAACLDEFPPIGAGWIGCRSLVFSLDSGLRVASNPSLSCPVADASLNGIVSIGEVTQCVNLFLNGC